MSDHRLWRPHEYSEYVRLFNERDFFEAHEVLEEAWVIEVPPLKSFYKGLIQAAVAICHWERGNPSGARKLWRTARAYLEPYPDRYEGLDLGRMIAALDVLFAPLMAAAPAELPELRRELIPVLALEE